MQVEEDFSENLRKERKNCHFRDFYLFFDLEKKVI